MDALAAAFEPEKADVCAGCGRSGLQLLVCDDCSPGPVDQGSLVKKRCVCVRVCTMYVMCHHLCLCYDK